MSKIKFKTNELLPKVSQVAQVVNQKNTIAILENLVLETYNGKFLTITASDGETWLLVSAPIEIIEGEVKCCINAQRLNTALKSLGGVSDVEVDFDEQSHIAKFIYPSGNFELPFLDAEVFPNPATNEQAETCQVALSNKHLLNGIGLTEFATDTDSLHPQFNGIHVDFINNQEIGKTQMVFVATDTRKLVRYTESLNTMIDELNDKGFTLPKKAAITILQLLATTEQDDDSCEIVFNEQNFVLQNRNSKLSTRLINGRFPNYNAVIPTNNEKMAIVNRDALIGALRRVMAFANQKTLMATLTFENDKVILDTKDIDYSTSAQETVECKYQNELITIGFPCNGLIDVVKNVRCEDVAIKLSDQTRAALIIPSAQQVGTEYISIQMPMQIN